MKEFDELKQKLKELLDVFGSLGASVWKSIDAFLAKFIKNASARFAILIMIGSFAAGVVFTSAISGARGKGFELPLKGMSFLRYFFAPTMKVSGKQPDGQFIISNFESPDDLRLWTVRSAKVEISSDHESEGKMSGKVTLMGDVESSAVTVGDYFESRTGESDWSNYEALSFEIYNPSNEKRRLIFQIKDRGDGRYKTNLILPPASSQTYIFPINKLDGSIDVKNVVQMTIFTWEPKTDFICYLDNLRLIPHNYQKGGDTVSTKNKFQNAPVPKNRPVNLVDYGFKQKRRGWEVHDAQLATNVVRVPFIVKDEAGAPRNSYPAQGGIPFARGELLSTENVRIKDVAGREVSFQTRVLAVWPDKSIRWLQVDIQTSMPPYGGAGYFLEYAPQLKPNPPLNSSLTISEEDNQMIVNTGPLKLVLDKTQFYLFKEVYLDKNNDKTFSPEELMTKNVPLTLMFRGKKFSSDLDRTSYELVVEEKGPEKIGLKASGWFQAKDGQRFCQWIVRIHAFKGKSYLRVYHTLIYTGYPENRYYDRYKELKLPENETIEDLAIEMPLSFDPQNSAASFGVNQASPAGYGAVRSLDLFQDSYDTNIVEKDGSQIGKNIPVQGWMDVSDQKAGLTVAVRDFRENFPKEYIFDSVNQILALKLWPSRAGELDLQTTADAFGPDSRARGNAFGLGKTHELFFNFHQPAVQNAAIFEDAKAFQEPLMLRVNPYWMDSTGVLGRLYPVNEKYASQEKTLEKLFDWAARHPKDYKWYGMLNFGDTLQWHRKEDDEQWYGEAGWHPIGRWGWYNCENTGNHSGALLQYVRSGLWKYFQFGEDAARHIMDVDTVHYNTIAHDPRLKVMDDEVSQVGSMHRHNGNHWGDRNEEATHTNVYGILLYYYLTGYERAFDVAKEVGSFFLQNPMTYTQHPDIAPHRALANILWGDVQLYQATWDEHYKRNADQIVEVYLQGQNSDGSYYETYDPMSGKWSGEKHILYMAYYAIRAFIAYHELTQDREVLDALDKMVRYVRKDVYQTPSVINGTAYLYLMTKNPEFVDMAAKDLKFFVDNQLHSNDSIMDGLIFKKPIYHRPNVFLYSVPFVFAALEESFQQPSQQ